MAKDLAPNPGFPERFPTQFERKESPATVGNRGPLRFEEGIATDTDVPNDFATGVNQGLQTPPGRFNHNANVFEKPAAETMQERAHVGSAAWVEAPALLNEFAGDAFAQYNEYEFPQVKRNGGRYERTNPARVPNGE